MISSIAATQAQKWNIWNARNVIDNNSKQNIAYLPQINESPTKDAVVFKTLQIASEIAVECSQPYILTTYDLAIAKKAYRIQEENEPLFKNVFILLGPFHIKLSYYKIIGKYIEDSGIPALMISCGLIADGSMNSFISGKHYNRCKRLHAVGALSFKCLHFKQFLRQNNDFNMDEVRSILESELNTEQNLKDLNNLLQRYQHFCEQTMNGAFGKTAQFAYTYIYMVDMLNLFERSIRTSDIELFIYAVFEMNGLFFVFNHQNYARWLVKYNDNLQNINTTHPGLYEYFVNGGLSIRRTNKNFARSPIDLTLEQTINARSANRLTGIAANTNNLNGRQKWAETHSIRMAIIQQLYEFTNLIKTDDTTESKCQTRVFNEQFGKLTSEINNCLNPFDDSVQKDNLYNLSTGKAASNDTSEFLLNAVSVGKKKLVEFIDQCKNNPSRFDQPISRNKVKTFSNELHYPNKGRSTKISKKVNDSKMENDIIRRMICMAINCNSNLETLFSYPLTSVPHTLAQTDGSINLPKNGEISLLFNDTAECESLASIRHDVEIIDGNDLLVSLTEAPNTYGQIAIYVLKKICSSTASEFHVIFHTWSESGLPNFEERKNSPYEDNAPAFKINGPNQERILKWSKCVKNKDFRNEFVTFCLNYWKDVDIGEILENKRVFIANGSECYLFCKDYEKKRPISSMESSHISVDLKLIFHVSKTCSDCRILIKSPNSDAILIYLLYHMKFWSDDKKIWLLTGNSMRRNSELTNVRKIFDQLETNIISALPAWYVFCGCALEPAFYGKGRKTTYKKLRKDKSFIDAFCKVGDRQMVSEEICRDLEIYTCELYMKGQIKVNSARVHIFEKANRDKAGKLNGCQQKCNSRKKPADNCGQPYKFVFLLKVLAVVRWFFLTFAFLLLAFLIYIYLQVKVR